MKLGENCSLPGYYAASSGNLLPTSDYWPLKMGMTDCPETSLRNCH